MLDARCSILDARCSILDARCSMLDTRIAFLRLRSPPQITAIWGGAGRTGIEQGMANDELYAKARSFDSAALRSG